MVRVIGCLLVASAAALLVYLACGGPQSAAAPKLPGGDVRDFGAKGDGVADDSAAIQKALDASPGTVFFSPGAYRITKPIVIDLDKTGFTTLRGNGVARVIMAGEGSAFKFIGTHGGTAQPSSVKDNVWAKERMPGVDGIEIVGEHEKANGIEAAGTMKLTITRVLIRRCFHGIHLTSRNRNVLIADSHIYHNRGIGVFMDKVNLHQINITGSHISYNDGGGVACIGGEVRNIQITGCDIEANHGKDGPPTANVLVDSTGGTNAEVAITGNTIQHTRNAPGSANVRIKGPTVPNKGTDEVRDGHVTITGNVMSDVKVNIHLDHARGVAITGNTMWTGEEYNLLAEKSSNVVIGVNNLDRNPRYHREEEKATDAVLFRECSDCTISGLQVVGVRHAPAAIALEKCDRFNITNVAILDCDGVGLDLKDVTRSRVSGCLIRDDRPPAKSLSIRTGDGQDNSITDNTFGRPHEILKGVGLVERNFEPWRK
ncbi:MAG: right-handed parallel beta-helix repeat-containing protein [Gemmataceae bacterium]